MYITKQFDKKWYITELLCNEFIIQNGDFSTFGIMCYDDAHKHSIIKIFKRVLESFTRRKQGTKIS